MDESFGLQGNASRERARDGGDTRTQGHRALIDATLKIHAELDPSRLLPTTVESLRTLVGPCSGQILVKLEGHETKHPFGSHSEMGATAQALAACAKAMETGHPVVDTQVGSRALALPLQAEDRLVGALYLAAADLEKRLGPTYLDLLSLFARHVATGLDNAYHVRDLLADRSGAEENEIPAGLSLGESKQLFERKLIRTRLREARGNIAAAARSLEMDRGQLSRLLKKHGVDKIQYKASGNTGA